MIPPATHRNIRMLATVYGIVPCILGIALGQYVRLSGYVWITTAGGFWPVFCLLVSLFACLYLVMAKVNDRTLRLSAWLMLTWTWLYIPFWLAAVDLPRASAVVGADGRVSMVSAWARADGDRALLFAGRGGNKIIRNVEGSATIHAVDMKYRYSEPYIASRRDGDDLAIPVVDAMAAALAVEVARPRLARIALFETKEVHSRFLADVCDNVVHGKGSCPLNLTLTATAAATLPGGLWSKQFTEQEAITERHLPALISLLTQDNLRVVRKDVVYALFMEVLLGNIPGIVKRVAVNYYGRSLMYAAGAPEGLTTPDPQWFEPLSVETASWALLGIAVGGLLLATVIFSRREYRDLT